MNPEQLKEMNEITWWNRTDLDGVITRGGHIKLHWKIKNG